MGWSFGGLLARWVAHQRPAQVRQVVTMGSPWRPEGERTRSTRMFERSKRVHGICERAEKVIDELRGSVPVFATAIWSKSDGIVPWQGCAVDEDEPGQVDARTSTSRAATSGWSRTRSRWRRSPTGWPRTRPTPEPFEWRRVRARRAS